jgi:hypothetical protein
LIELKTKESKNVEELRHCATLAEKAISSNTVNTISQTVLEEIQTLKDQRGMSLRCLCLINHKMNNIVCT